MATSATATTSSSTTAAATAAASSTTGSAASSGSAGAAILTALNAGSGIDTSSLVTQLTAAQKASLESGITTKQTANTAQVSAAATLASDITAFSSALDSLIAGGTLQSTPTSTDTSVVSATALSGARLGGLSASVEVKSLATAQVLQSADQTGQTFSGNLTLTVAGKAQPAIAIPAGSSLADVASAINAAKTGVTASVVTSGAKTVLVLKGATGAANAFSVTGDDPSLAALAYDPAASGGNAMTATAAAADADLFVDGVEVTSASNTVKNAVAGVTLTLGKLGTVQLTGTRPTAAITQAVSDYVAAYNSLKSDIDSATAAGTSTSDAGALRGNSTVRDMQRQLGALTTTRLTAGGAISTLAQLGVQTNQDGTLTVSSDTLSSVLARYPDDVEAMFNPAQSSTSAAVTITSKIGAVAAGTYQLTGLQAPVNGQATLGAVNGVVMTGIFGALTAPAGSPAAGLSVALSTTQPVPSSATLTIDLGLAGALAQIKNALVGTSGSITSFQAQLKTQTQTLADQLSAADEKVTVYHDRLVSQFSAMNTRVSAYKATQSYLTQQVDLWTKSTN